MRFVVLDTAGGRRTGLIDGEQVVDLNRAYQLTLAGPDQVDAQIRARSERELPSRLEDLLANDPRTRARAIDAALGAASQARADRGAEWLARWQVTTPLDEAVLAAPVAENATLYGIALNYTDHADEAQMEAPKYPTIFIKPAGALRGPDVDVPLPHEATQRVDYEGELAVVIGRRAHHVSARDAGDVIAGYTLANDLSARDWQFRTSEMTIGKAFDGFCPMGPWLATPDECPEPEHWVLRTHVNGDQRQQVAFSEMIFPVSELIAYLSQAVTLHPGDAILTGTPAGIGATRKPRLWLRPDDVVEVTADALGTLRTTLR